MADMGEADAARLPSLRGIAARRPELNLLVLHGSRARGEATPLSDWDFAYLSVRTLDEGALIADLCAALETDRVDLVDLARASAVLRFRAARDGVCVYERVPGAFDRFVVQAVHFWCDAGSIVERGYADVLAELGP